jgi:hypothetical protein
LLNQIICLEYEIAVLRGQVLAHYQGKLFGIDINEILGAGSMPLRAKFFRSLGVVNTLWWERET